MVLASSTPDWLTLLVAVIGGGAVGTLITTFWRVRHERAESWRSRLLDSADDFATGALQAFMKLEYMGDWLWRSHESGDPYLSPVETKAMQEADALVDQARARLARVHLLYGSTSITGGCATAVINELRTISSSLWGDPDGGVLDFASADVAREAAREALDAFSASARAAAWKGRSDRSWLEAIIGRIRRYASRRIGRR
jgi:hypothetical protein